MTEVKDAVTLGGAYKESDSFVPDPTDQYAILDTSGTAGSAHGQVEAVTPIFEVAKAQDKITAAKALDPEDDSVPASLVVLPQGTVIAESGEKEARERVAKAAENLKPVEVGGPDPFQREAAKSGEEAGAKADSQSLSNSGGGLDGGTGGTKAEAPAKSSGGKAGSAGGAVG